MSWASRPSCSSPRPPPPPRKRLWSFLANSQPTSLPRPTGQVSCHCQIGLRWLFWGAATATNHITPPLSRLRSCPDAWCALQVKSTKFLSSAYTADQLPPPKWPEVAVLGRSNVGKSSLVNYLLGSNILAKVSNTPGTWLLYVARTCGTWSSGWHMWALHNNPAQQHCCSTFHHAATWYKSSA